MFRRSPVASGPPVDESVGGGVLHRDIGAHSTGDSRPMRVELPSGVVEMMIAEARRKAPEEACGLLVGRRGPERFEVARAVACQNEAPPERRTRRFEIDPRRVIELEREARHSSEEVVGFYHSHPESDPVPSEVDRTYMGLWPDAVWVIVGGVDEDFGMAMRAWSVDPLSLTSFRELEVRTVDAERVEQERP